MPYYERLKECNLTTLELSRHRGDLSETFKILTEREGIDKAKNCSPLLRIVAHGDMPSNLGNTVHDLTVGSSFFFHNG